MPVIGCLCGYTCGTQVALDRHIARFAEDATQANRHGPSPLTLQVRELKEKFTTFDESGDRHLDFEELCALLRRGDATISDNHLQTLFSQVDVSKDGLIDFDEFTDFIFGSQEEEQRDANLEPSDACSVSSPLHSLIASPLSASAPMSPPVKGSSTGPRPRFATEPGMLAPPKQAPLAADNEPRTPPRRAKAHAVTQANIMSSPTSTAPSSPPLRHRAATNPATSSQASPGNGAAIQLLIIRHAQSGNKEKGDLAPGERKVPSEDPLLSQVGYEEAEMLGERLAKDFRRMKAQSLIVASSPMRRCLLTIRPAVHKLGLTMDDCFCHGGCYEFGCAGTACRGSSTAEIAQNFPEFQLVGFSDAGFWDYRGEEPKENETDARERGVRVAEFVMHLAAELRNRDVRGERTLMLTIHQTLADLLLHILLEGSSDNWQYGEITYRMRNTAITTVILEADGSARLGKKNDASHLPGLASPVRSIPSITPTQKTKRIVQLRERFAKFDGSGDRKLDYREMSELLRKGDATLSEETLQRLFNTADEDGDGSVDFDEFVNFIFSTSSA